MIKKKKLFILSLLLSLSLLILSGCSSNPQNDITESTDDKVPLGKGIDNETDISSIPTINDLSKIDMLITLKFERDTNATLLPFNEVVSLFDTAGVIAYPEETDENLKVMYWIFEENNQKYFLDTIFFMDKLVNIESRLVEPSSIVENNSLNVPPNFKDEISNIKSLSELKELFGEPTLGMEYFTPSKDRIYIWKYKNEFISAYVFNDDTVSYTEISEDVTTLLKSATNCH